MRRLEIAVPDFEGLGKVCPTANTCGAGLDRRGKRGRTAAMLSCPCHALEKAPTKRCREIVNYHLAEVLIILVRDPPPMDRIWKHNARKIIRLVTLFDEVAGGRKRMWLRNVVFSATGSNESRQFQPGAPSRLRAVIDASPFPPFSWKFEGVRLSNPFV